MNDSKTPPDSKQPSLDAIDFELTDFDTARGALEEPPAGVKALQRPEPAWHQLRRERDPREFELRASTLTWLRSVEPGLRPRQLVSRFPRIANQIATAWADPTACLRMLGHLLLDQRGGRRGFPSGIAQELTVLQQHLLSRVRITRG